MAYKLGIIGYGGFGGFLQHSWEKLSNVKVVAVWKRVPPTNLSAGIKFYEKWEDILSREDIQIISIATPPALHTEMACAALEAGKHLIVEKPLATNPEEAKKIINIRNKTAQVATVDFMLRFNPLIEILQKISADKILGELRRVDVENYAQDEGLPKEHWFWDKTISGGILVEHAVHFIDLVHSLTDQKYISVTGASHYRNPKQEDQVLASVLYDRGLMASHYHSFARPGFFEITTIRLAYDLAQIDLEGWIPLKGKITALVNEKTKPQIITLPGFKLESCASVAKANDISRPEGWGEGDVVYEPQRPAVNRVYSGGTEYRVEEIIKGSFAIPQPKVEVYAESLRKLLIDVIAAIENPKHKLKVSLEDGLASLEVAYQASCFANKKS